MRRFIGTLSVFVVLATGTWANILHEDNIYWLNTVDANGRQNILINPTTADLQREAPNLLFKIEETVYDIQQSMALQARAGVTNPVAAFLYTYTVANLGSANGDISMFQADWNAGLALNWYVVRPNNAVWQAKVPAPSWGSIVAGVNDVMPGSSVGGLWALSLNSDDSLVTASLTVDGRVVKGWTTGPVPEPTTVASIIVGAAMLLGLRRRK